MITLPVLASVTATTRDEGEFMRVIDWCYDVAKIGSWVAAGHEDGIRVVRLTLPEDDIRLERFADQVEARFGWTVERWPDREEEMPAKSTSECRPRRTHGGHR